MNRAREPRLVIAQRPTRRDRLHGAWWPRSTDVSDELEPMLDAVGLRFEAVLGVMLNSAEWPAAVPSLRPSVSGKVKISWYGLTETHLVVLRCKDSRRIALLLLPPDTLEAVALTATLMASTPGNDLSADETLARAAVRGGSAVWWTGSQPGDLPGVTGFHL